MTLSDLIQRTWAKLGQGAALYFPADQPIVPDGISEVVDNGLNVAQRMLVLLRPALLTQRVPVSLIADEVFIDLRLAAPRMLRPQRVVLGDVTTPAPVATASTSVGDLRPTTLHALRSQQGWFSVRRAVPSRWYPHGLSWVCTWPRATQPITVTLVGQALPTPLQMATPTQVPDLPVQWHPLIADLAACLLDCKQGSGEAEQAVQRMGTLVGDEPLVQPLLKLLRAERYKAQARAQIPTTSSV